jgi:hypothetical protein
MGACRARQKVMLIAEFKIATKWQIQDPSRIEKNAFFRIFPLRRLLAAENALENLILQSNLKCNR